MSNSHSSALKRVLFVDDSPRFLECVRAEMPVWSGAKWELEFATSPIEAFTIMDAQRVDLVVIDLRTSSRETGVDSLQFMKLVHCEYPSMGKVIISWSLEPDKHKTYLRAGASLYLVKPKQPNEYETLFHALDQLVASVPGDAPEAPADVPEAAVVAPTVAVTAPAEVPVGAHAGPVSVPEVPVAVREAPVKSPAVPGAAREATEGFRGVLHAISLSDLIQLECRNCRSSVLEISSGGQFGQVFIKGGAIIHVNAGTKTGMKAFVRLMNMSGGGFNLEPFYEPGMQTIEMSCERLLLEASHTLDMSRVECIEELSPNGKTSWFQNAAKGGARSVSG